MAIPRILIQILNQLVRARRLSEDQVHDIMDTDEELSGENLEKLLMEKYRVSPLQILMAKGRAFELTAFNVKNLRISDKTFEKLNKDFCLENKVLPVGVIGDHYLVVIADPFNLGILNKIQEITHLKVSAMLSFEPDLMGKLEVKKEVATPQSKGFTDVMESLNEEFGTDPDAEIKVDNIEDDSSPVVQLASRIIEEAYYAGGSDIHIEPFENSGRIRVRVDGVCQEKLTVPPKVMNSLLARLKVMANLDIAEKRLPQDGRIVYKQYNKRGIDVDLRVSTAPLNHGEGAVMRILDKQKSTLPLTALGFSEANLTKYRELIQQPYGMILHCGPTGSGKSMTLYSALNEINTPDVCIRTAEDPIEYTLPGLLQMQMHRTIGLTFASALRAFLRQDPDIILVGEIRDQETAHIAIEAALTGHMLFSTLHTNDAPSTISRLKEMEVEPFMISASLVCVCAQRLMRRVCKTCKQPYELEGREYDLMERAIDWHGKVFRANPTGCPNCNNRGYRGRVGIHELMATSEELVKGINMGYETAKLKKIACRNGMKTLHQDSMLKVQEGVTTIMEAIANVPADMEDLRKVCAAATLEEALAES